MVTPEREINPPSCYEKDELESYDCNYCFESFTEDKLHLLKRSKQSEFICSECKIEYDLIINK